jgi:hypothetical protein
VYNKPKYILSLTLRENIGTKGTIWVYGDAVIGGRSSFAFPANYYYKSRKRLGQHVTRMGEKGLNSGGRKT